MFNKTKIQPGNRHYRRSLASKFRHSVQNELKFKCILLQNELKELRRLKVKRRIEKVQKRKQERLKLSNVNL